MHKEFKYLLSEISASESKEWGAMIKLIDEEHVDYIEDVLAEKFDIEYEFKTIENNKKEYILYFVNKCKLEKLEEVVKLINKYHNQNNELYETI